MEYRELRRIYSALNSGMERAIRQVHEHGLIHKEIAPANILVDVTSGGCLADGLWHCLSGQRCMIDFCRV